MLKAILFIIGLLFFSCAQPATGPFRLVETNAIGSCMTFKILGENQQDYQLNEKLKRALNCPRIVSIKNDILIYEDGLDIRLLKLQDGTDNKLFSMFEDVDGIAEPAWSDDMRSVLFLVINQEKTHGYKSFTRLISLQLDNNYVLKSKEKYDRPVNFSCGSICSAVPYEDFFYEGTKIKYKRNINIDERPGIFELIE